MVCTHNHHVSPILSAMQKCKSACKCKLKQSTCTSPVLQTLDISCSAKSVFSQLSLVHSSYYHINMACMCTFMEDTPINSHAQLIQAFKASGNSDLANKCLKLPTRLCSDMSNPKQRGCMALALEMDAILGLFVSARTLQKNCHTGFGTHYLPRKCISQKSRLAPQKGKP